MNEKRENRHQRKERERVNRVKIVVREEDCIPKERTVYEAWKVIEGLNPHVILKTQSCSVRRRDACSIYTHETLDVEREKESRTDRQ